MYRWLVFYITSHDYEYDYFFKKVIPFMEKIRPNDIEVDVLLIGRINKSTIIRKIYLFNLTATGLSSKKISKKLSISAIVDNILAQKYRTYQSIMMCSHSNGIIIGSDGHSVIEVVDLYKLCKKYFTKNRKLDFLIFDCCYMGSLESLYEVSSLSNYILATPSYHIGHIAMLEFPGMYIYRNDKLPWLQSFVDWYIADSVTHSKKIDYAVQLVIYSAENIKILAKFFIASGLYKLLQFNKESIIYWDDDNLYNIESVLEYTLEQNDDLFIKIELARMLIKKAYLYYLNAPSDKRRSIEECVLSIHNGLPKYLPNIYNCKLKMFKKTYCQ